MARMSIQTALEHAKDGADCMVEANRVAKKLQKDYPHLNAPLETALDHMRKAREAFGDVEAGLKTAAAAAVSER